MPGRLMPLITGQIYHVFNRGIDKRPTFTDKREYKRAVETIKFYRINKPPIKLSKFIILENNKKDKILEAMEISPKLVQIICFCLMPNHFHFLLKQKEKRGIPTFLSNFQNRYTRYFNTRHEKDGSLFLGQFKAVLVEDDEQLLHLSRYIHLNPYVGFVIKSIFDSASYSWSSFQDYLSGNLSFINNDIIMSNFKDSSDYRQFVLDQADYQRKLKKIKHLILE